MNTSPLTGRDRAAAAFARELGAHATPVPEAISVDGETVAMRDLSSRLRFNGLSGRSRIAAAFNVQLRVTK